LAASAVDSVVFGPGVKLAAVVRASKANNSVAFILWQSFFCVHSDVFIFSFQD
jgi:hypothetical protein